MLELTTPKILNVQKGHVVVVLILKHKRCRNRENFVEVLDVAGCLVCWQFGCPLEFVVVEKAPHKGNKIPRKVYFDKLRASARDTNGLCQKSVRGATPLAWTICVLQSLTHWNLDRFIDRKKEPPGSRRVLAQNSTRKRDRLESKTLPKSRMLHAFDLCVCVNKQISGCAELQQTQSFRFVHKVHVCPKRQI